MLRTMFCLSGVMLLSACTNVWAQVVADRMVNDQLSISSFRGRLVEQHILVDAPDTKVVREVLYQKLWKYRVEVKEPEALAGQLFIYDGQQLIMWWPEERFGMRIRNVPAPSVDEFRRFMRTTTDKALQDYAFSRRARTKVAGQATDKWMVIPVQNGLYRYPYDSWMDREHSIPLKLVIYDAPKHPWYQMQYEEIAFDQPVPEDAFSFAFPKNAVVLDWDMAAPDIPLEKAKERMNFDILMPKVLPPGHRVSKIIEDRTVVPMVALLMNDGPRWISLTQLRQVGEATPPPTGKAVKLGAETGYLNFMGGYTVITWVKKGTSLSLISNLAYPDVVAIAASVE